MSRKTTSCSEVVVEGRVYRFTMRRSQRARQLILKMDGNGAIEVIVPWRVAKRMADEFVRSRAGWVEKTRRKYHRRLNKQKIKLVSGAFLPVLGDVRQLAIMVEPDRQRTSWQEQGNLVHVMVPRAREVRKVVVRWYRMRMKDYTTRLASRLADRLGVKVSKIVISDARSQWGSCIRKKGRISIQWRLAQAPLGVLDYVIAHEVMHLKVGGHSEAFWKGVETVCPDYQARRRWLKDNGYGLYVW